MAKEKKQPELVDAPPEKKMARLDNLLRGVLSVSNKTVREKMEREKRNRKAAKK